MRVYPALRITFDSPRPPDQVELLAARLDEFQPVALEEFPDGLRAFFPNAAARDAALADLAASGWMDLRTEDVPDENWAERSQAALTAVTVGRLTIAPPWAVTAELRDTAPGPVIVIQPSMGFGTGHHASTRLCLQLMQEIDLRGKRVLDIGTGSGVLAIAAHVLGASPVMAIDVDSDALVNAAENLRMNGISDQIDLRAFDFSTAAAIPGEPFDLILANLTADLLTRITDRLASAGKPEAHLILSGIQESELDNVLNAFQLNPGVECRFEGGWSAVRLQNA